MSEGDRRISRSSVGESVPSFHEKNSNDDNDSDVDDDMGTGNNNTMMSIFASYYGIEDDSKKNKLLIDSPQFDADEYIQDLLSNQTVEYLATKDAALVHEIRALDSDMQMLVYENYNKFISATETIKRMKSNVDGMDEDLDSVKQNMDKITDISSTLDGSLSDKRTKVSKLVRVRRLLQKLEFLSELPEKLVELINVGQYKRAVQLYRRTITVLTKHSHLLSFKNIKERTERMMTDLRDKVTGLLDDSSLDGVKLTHYATILHLMEAPRDRVVEKLLHAHQSRAQRVILDFVASTARPAGSSTTPSGSAIVSALPSVTRTTAVSVVSAAASPSSPSGEKRVQPSTNDLLEAVSNVRKFHHTIVAGLVEACNGFNEVFAPVEGLTSPNGRGGSQSAFTPRSDTDEKVPENASTSPEDDVKKEEIVQQELEARCKAYTQLKHTLDQIAPQYQDHFVNSIQSFFTQLNEHIQYCQELEDEYLKNPDQPIGVVGPLSKVSTNPFADDDTGGSIYDEPTTSVSQAELHKKIISAEKKSTSAVNARRTAQLRLFDMEEARKAWLFLVRQAVLDWEFLDRSLAKCRPADDTSSTLPSVSELYSSSFATVVLDSLELQCRQHFDLAAIQVVHELVHQVQDMEKLIDLAGEANRIHARVIEGSSTVSAVSSTTYNSTSSSVGSNSTHGSTHGSSHGTYSSTMSQTQYAEFSALRALIQKKCGEAKSAMDHMVEIIATYFAKVCSEVKPVMDIYEIIHAHSPAVVTQSSTSANSSNSVVMATGVDLMRRFIQHVCSLLEVYYGVRHSREGLQGSTEQADFHLGYLYDEWSHVSRPWEATHLPAGRLLTFQVQRKKVPTSDGENSVNLTNKTLYPYITQLWEKTLASTSRVASGISGFIIHSFFHRCASQLVGRLENELTTADLYSFADEKTARNRAVSRMSVAARNILLHQVETMTHSLCAGISESLFNAPSDGHTDATVHESVIQVSVCIDSLVTGCCVFLTEPLPQPPKYVSLDKETNRRQSNATAPGRGKQSVQLDIERVFAQEIQIFDPEAICSGTVEGLVAAVLKPILKCVGESLRMGNLDTGAYKNANADVTYLKQVGNMFLKQAVVDTDRLAEQVSMIVFSRYIFSNDIAKSSDHFESMQVSRAVREALVITAKKAVFFPR